MKAAAIFALVALASAQSADPYIQFLTGFLNTLEPSIGGQVAPCLSGTTGGISAVRIGLGLIENGLATGNVTAVFEGALQFNTALTDIKLAATSCGVPTVEADIQKIIDQLGNNPLGVLAALFPYADTIVTDLQSAIGAFKSGNFTAAGQNIGSVLVIILTDTVSALKLNKLAADPYIDFLNGLLTTLAPAVGGKVTPCLGGADGSITEIRAGVALLKEAIHNRNWTAAVDAFLEFKGALSDIEAAANQCNVPAVAADIKTLITELTTNPLGVVYKLLPHIATIVIDVEAAASAISSGNYNLAGQSIGSILALIIA